MKTTLDLPDELIREVKIRAVMQGRTLKDLIADLLRQGLNAAPPTRFNAPSTSSMVDIADNGVPLIRCRPDAAARFARIEDLLALEQQAHSEEDMRHAGLSS